MNIEILPYTYLIGWSKLDKWYYGVRFSKHIKIDEFWKNYFTSSKHVNKFRKIHGDPDVILIRKYFDSSSKAKKWEHKILRRLKVSSNKKWINQCANLFPFNADDKSYMQTKEYKKRLSDSLKGRIPWNKGKKMSSDWKQTNPQPKSKLEKQSQRFKDINNSRIGSFWITNGNKNIMTHDQILPEGWRIGFTIFNSQINRKN